MNIIITGASRGLGYYTALQLAKSKEHKIFALSRDERGLKKLSDESGIDTVVAIPCDITDEKSILETVKRITELVSGIEVLINNAGQLINKPFLELSRSDWQSVYDVNVFGIVNLTRALMPLLMKGTILPEANIKSHILNITSMGGVQGSIKFSGLSAYSSSKAALMGISECLSEELKSSQIFVNSIALGSVETEMFVTAFPGLKAASTPEEISMWLTDFVLKGFRFFNGKIIPVSISTP